jgi:hypothetical protein
MHSRAGIARAFRYQPVRLGHSFAVRGRGGRRYHLNHQFLSFDWDKHATRRLTAQGICSYFVLIMPESYRDKRGLPPYLLSAAVKNGTLIEAKCCGTRWYVPQDLITLYGDIPVMNLERHMRCGKCRELMRVRATSPLAEERQKIRLRRLDKVWWVRRASWKWE